MVLPLSRYCDFGLEFHNLCMSQCSGPHDRQSAESLISEAQTARIKAHLRAILAKLKSRSSKPLRELS